MKVETNQIYNMDALELLRWIPDQSVDLILTDPPYGIFYQNHFTRMPHPPIAGDGNLDYEAVASHCHRILKNNTHAYFFTRFDQYPTHFAVLEEVGFTVKNCLIIEKNTVGGIGDLMGSFANNAEWIIFCQKGRRQFSRTQLLRNHKGGQRPAATRKINAEFKTRFPCCWFGEEYPKATYNANWLRKHGIIHPTVKNVRCLEWLISISTLPGELVVDPFMGSGSTALAARRAGRRFLGSEIREEYHALSLRRLETDI